MNYELGIESVARNCKTKQRYGASGRTTPSVSRKRLPAIRNLNRREQARLFRLIRSARSLSPLAPLASLTSGREPQLLSPRRGAPIVRRDPCSKTA